MNILRKLMTPMPEQFQSKYLELVDHLIVTRMRFVALVGIPLHIIFNYYDCVLYPDYGRTFLLIRCIDSLIIAVIVWLSFFKGLERMVSKWFGAFYLIPSAGMATMIALKAGVLGGYHEGFNIVILALLFVNGFYVRKNIFYSLIMWSFYVMAALWNQENWDFQKFLFANYFVLTTIIFVSIVTFLYSRQHRDGFIKNEKLLENEIKLRQLAITDDLTQIHNRRHFFDLLKTRMVDCIKEKSFFYIVIFDIDHFKRINDTYGHPVGDKIIEKVAKAVESVTRKGSLLGRYGGDEFIMMINNAPREALLKRLKEVQNTIHNIDFGSVSKLIKITISMGVAKFDSQHHSELRKVVETADLALLEVKRTARGTILIKED